MAATSHEQVSDTVVLHKCCKYLRKSRYLKVPSFLHVCCVSCLRGPRNKRKVTYPTCSEPITGNVGSLPKAMADITLQTQLDHFLSGIQETTTVSKACEGCLEENSAVSYCRTCSDKYQCSGCVEKHVADSHDIHWLRKHEYCSKHGNNYMYSFCIDCDKVICSTCIISEHLYHDPVDLEREFVVDPKKKLLTEFLEDLLSLEGELDEYLNDYMQNIGSDVTAKYFTAEVNLTKQLDKLDNKSEFEKILDNLRYRKSQDVDKLTDHVTIVAKLRSTCAKVSSYLNNLFTEDDVYEIVQSGL